MRRWRPDGSYGRIAIIMANLSYSNPTRLNHSVRAQKVFHVLINHFKDDFCFLIRVKLEKPVEDYSRMDFLQPEY